MPYDEYSDSYVTPKPPFGIGRALCITFDALLGLFFGLILCFSWADIGGWSFVITITAALLAVLTFAPFAAAVSVAQLTQPAWVRRNQWLVFALLVALTVTFFILGKYLAPDPDVGRVFMYGISALMALLSLFAFSAAMWANYATAESKEESDTEPTNSLSSALGKVLLYVFDVVLIVLAGLLSVFLFPVVMYPIEMDSSAHLLDVCFLVVVVLLLLSALVSIIALSVRSAWLRYFQWSAFAFLLFVPGILLKKGLEPPGIFEIFIALLISVGVAFLGLLTALIANRLSQFSCSREESR